MYIYMHTYIRTLKSSLNLSPKTETFSLATALSGIPRKASAASVHAIASPRGDSGEARRCLDHVRSPCNNGLNFTRFQYIVASSKSIRLYSEKVNDILFSLLCCAVLLYTVQHHTWYCVVPRCIVLVDLVPENTLLFCAIPYNTVLCHSILYYTILELS